MYPVAIDCGVSVERYWDLTLIEIKDILDSYERTQKRRKKEKVEELFILAEVTANRILNGLNGKSSYSDYVQPHHYYPDLFENVDELIEKKKEEEELQRYKEDMKARADAWNKRFREMKNGTGKTES